VDVGAAEEDGEDGDKDVVEDEDGDEVE